MEAIRHLAYSGAVDADGHILEAADLWEQYLEPRYRERALRLRIERSAREEADARLEAAERVRRLRPGDAVDRARIDASHPQRVLGRGSSSSFDGTGRGGGLYLLDTTATIDHGSVATNSISGAETTFGKPLELDYEVIAGGGHLNTDAGYGPWPDVEAWALSH